MLVLKNAQMKKILNKDDDHDRDPDEDEDRNRKRNRRRTHRSSEQNTDPRHFNMQVTSADLTGNPNEDSEKKSSDEEESNSQSHENEGNKSIKNLDIGYSFSTSLLYSLIINNFCGLMFE
jgi:hypothetical protein